MRPTLTGALIATLVIAVLLLSPAFLTNLNYAGDDVVTALAGPGRPSGRVAIVEIDESSITRFGRWPWRRDLLASLIRRVLDDGASVVVLDMVLDSPDEASPAEAHPAGITNDEAMAGMIRGRPVVTGFAFRFDPGLLVPANCGLRPLSIAVRGPEGSLQGAFFRPSGALCNVAPIAAAAAGNGFLNAAPDADGKLRTMPLVMQLGDREHGSLALTAFSLYTHSTSMQLLLNSREASQLRVGQRGIPLQGRSGMDLRFRGPHRTFPYFPAAAVLDGSIEAGALRNKVVLIGGSALGLPNPVATPVDPGLPDVEVQATAIDNLIQGDLFHRPGWVRFWELLIAFATGAVAANLIARARPWLSSAIMICTIAAVWLGCGLFARGGLLLSPVPLTAVLVCDLPAITLLNYIRERQRTERAEQQLARERVAAVTALQASESRYRLLVENIDEAIAVDNSEGSIVFANRRFQEWFGGDGAAAPGLNIRECAAPEWRDPLGEWRARRIGGEDVPDRYEFECVRSDGSRIWLEARVTTVSDEGKVTGAQWALRDITERKQIEARYLQAQKMESIGRLAGGVAHDFNNLLQVIIGYSDSLLVACAENSVWRKPLENIRAAGTRAAELTGNLLLFSRKKPGNLTLLDVNQVVSEAQRMCARLIGEDIELVSTLSKAPAFVRADSSQLLQILMNLLVNARDAMPRGGRIVMETRTILDDTDLHRYHQDFSHQPWVCIVVSDTGIGMTDEVKKHLFEPFFTTKEPGKGTGLGLATVYGIVEQTGGRVEVDSAPGVGTNIHIYLPAAEQEQPSSPVLEHPQIVAKGSETILLVEDESAVRRYVRAVLEKHGYNVIEAASGPEALTLAQSTQECIDLLISDLIMPGMDGRELAHILLQMKPGTRVVFMSGYPKESMDTRWDDTAVLVYLQKPFSPDRLMESVHEALHH